MRKYQYLRIFAMLWFMLGIIVGFILKFNNSKEFMWFVFFCFLNALWDYIESIIVINRENKTGKFEY